MNVNPRERLPDTLKMNDNFMQLTILLVLVIIAGILIYTLLSLRKHSPEPAADTASGKKGRPCPLCGERLADGEKVHSVLYPGEPDRLMEIYGCPHCRTQNSPNSRRCPVCRQQMPADDYLIARVFEKPGKTHVHVLGCGNCYKGRSRIKKTGS